MRSVCVPVLLFLSFFQSLSGDEVKVFIVAGQSNAVGYGSDANLLPPDLKPPQVDVLFWYEEGPYDSITNPSKRIKSNGWIPLQYQSDPNFGTFGGITDGFGPEIRLGRMLADQHSERVAILKFAINATSLAEDWNAATPSPLYTDLTSIVSSAMGELALLGHTASIEGFFWMQGEWDARNSNFAASYEANLTFFIQAVRTDLGEPDLPFILGRLHAEIYKSPYGISQVDLEAVRTAQENVTNQVPNTSMVDSDDFPLISDFIHFAAAGQLLLGQDFGVAHLAMSRPEPMNVTDMDTLDLYPGDEVQHAVTGPAGALYMVFLSLGGGPVNTAWGIAGLDPPVYFLWSGNCNNHGFDFVTLVMPDPAAGFITFYTHALVDDSPPVWAVGGNNPNGSGSIQWGLN